MDKWLYINSFVIINKHSHYSFVLFSESAGKMAVAFLITLLLHFEPIFCVEGKARCATLAVAKRIWSCLIVAWALLPFMIVSSVVWFCDFPFSYNSCNCKSCKIPCFILWTCFHLLRSFHPYPYCTFSLITINYLSSLIFERKTEFALRRSATQFLITRIHQTSSTCRLNLILKSWLYLYISLQNFCVRVSVPVTTPFLLWN